MKSAEKKTDRIIENALEILNESGAPGLTMRGLAERCGISLGNLQYHFKTREQLLEALLEFFLNECGRMSRDYLARLAGTPENNLKMLVRYNLENPLLVEWAGIFQELRAMGRRSPEIRAALKAYYAAYRDRVAEQLRVLAPGASRTEIRNTAGLLLVLLEGFAATRDYISIGSGKMTAAVIEYAAQLLELGDRF